MANAFRAFLLLVLIGGFGSWATFSSLSGAIIASGQIEVEKNRQVVQHPDGGVVAEIVVEEGELVQRNAVLVRLDPVPNSPRWRLSKVSFLK